MLLLGHIGITTGLAWLTNLCSTKLTRQRAYNGNSRDVTSSQTDGEIPANPVQGTLIHKLDIRLVMVGSILPDIIDKPIGHFIYRDIFNNGRIFSHSLLFLIFISLTGLILYKKRRSTWMLALSFGTLMHLILDQMWSTPETLLWPVYGLAFPKGGDYEWLPEMLHILTADPTAFIPEIIGGVILIVFCAVLLYKRKFTDFIKYGRY